MSPRAVSARQAHAEHHVVERAGWLRAAVLGANDGLLSTGSLLLGVAAASPDRGHILLSGVAGLVAGAMSMAAGEYVSVSSQSDSERADLAREKRELTDDPAAELKELTAIYVGRGLTPELARQVAEQLTAKDALSAHARDELGVSAATAARPVQAAFASALSFAAGALPPVLVALLSPSRLVSPVIAATSLLFLAGLGALGARIGGADVPQAAMRVTFWGAIAMATTAAIGALAGHVVTG